jgi:hypothetical protein
MRGKILSLNARHIHDLYEHVSKTKFRVLKQRLWYELYSVAFHCLYQILVSGVKVGH